MFVAAPLWTSCPPQVPSNLCSEESVKLLSATSMSTKILKMPSKLLRAGMGLGETWPDVRQTTLRVSEAG